MVRYFRPSAIPAGGVNHEKLQAELARLGDVGLSRDGLGWRVDILDAGIEDDAIQAVIDGHDGGAKTEAQVRVDERLVLSAVRDRLGAELVKGKPDWSGAYDDVMALVAGYERLLIVHDNVVMLQAEAYGLEVSKDNKHRQLLGFVDVLELVVSSA